MRISEIKNCFSDPRVRTCIAKDCWELPLFRDALNRYHGASDGEAIFQALRAAFLQVWPSGRAAQENRLEMKQYRGLLSLLSKRLFGSADSWMQGTAWETERQERKTLAEQQRANIEKASVLYQRLGLTPGVPRDVVVYAAKKPAIWQQITELEEAGTPVETRSTLYTCFENALIPEIAEKGINYVRFHVMSTVSLLAFGNRRYWADKNGMDFAALEAQVCSLSSRPGSEDSQCE